MQAARADNFYHPPDWDPQKGNLDKVRVRTSCFIADGGHRAKMLWCPNQSWYSVRRQRHVLKLKRDVCSSMANILFENGLRSSIKASLSSGTHLTRVRCSSAQNLSLYHEVAFVSVAVLYQVGHRVVSAAVMLLQWLPVMAC